MNRTEFSRYMGIPLRTLEEWEAGRRKMPEYVLRLMGYYTKMERLLVENKTDLEIKIDEE
ncbi:MAG: transcriptional regulator [Clostridia bacterium]|nr:transcriptional regulator [Clostridia bacterium]